MIWESNYVIESYICDCTDHLSLWGLGRLFQEVAEHHTHETQIGWLHLIKDNKAWVLTYMHYEIKRMPQLFEEVTVRTWSRGFNYYFAFRDFDLHDKQGNVICSATAYWSVIDFNTRHVVKLDSIMSGYEHHEQQATSLAKLKKIRIKPEGECSAKNIFTVTDSMLDHTQHVNNTEYLKWVNDVLPPAMLQKPERFVNLQIDVDYLLESRNGEEVVVERYDMEDKYYFAIINPRAKAATVIISDQC